MNEYERACFDARNFPARSFALFDTATGVIVSISHCQIPMQQPDLVVAVFDNIDWSLAMPGYRVDLDTVRDVEGDHPHCQLVPATD